MSLSTDGYLDTSALHPDLLMDACLALSRFIRHTRTRWQNNIDDLNGRRKVGRRDVLPHIARLRISPRAPIGAMRYWVGRRSKVLKQRSQRYAQPRGNFLQHDGRRTALSALHEREH